jgi:hypothetical protein
MNTVFANHSEDDGIYPLTTAEVADAQKVDATLKHLFKCNAVTDKGQEVKLIENTLCVCKDGQLVFPKPPMACSPMVSPLPTASWTHSSQRDDECCNVLERYAYHNLFTNKVLQDLPNKWDMKLQIWTPSG